MSHTTTLKGVAIRDIDAVRRAAANLTEKGIKCHVRENTRPRMYGSEQGPVCEHVLVLEGGSYDLGLKLQADGTYAPVFDEFGGNVSRHLGAACPVPTTAEGRAQHMIGKFLQEYGREAAIAAAAAQGYVVEDTTVAEDGSVHVTLAV